jgi:hydrogenase expression/formation protein HypE
MNAGVDFGSGRVALKHGAGSRAMRSLVQRVFVSGAAPSAPGAVGLQEMDDGAAIPLGDDFLVLTTDSHVVQPPFFPGGDIGRLAVCGTVNDLAMMGGTDVLGLTCGVILEEGFPFEALERVQRSVEEACREAGVRIVTGDTKVMGKGELDGIVINTSGAALTRRVVRDCGLRAGDRILVTGTIGDHGLAVLACRNQLAGTTPTGTAPTQRPGLGALRSDVAPLNDLVRAALAAGGDAVVALKDPTRGGLASTLCEMAEKSGVGIVLEEAQLPTSVAVRAAAELLGIDPLHVANEGKAVLGVAPEAAASVLDALRRHPRGRDAAIVGTCTAEHRGRLILDNGFGRRLVAELEGEPLPRIC